MNFIKNSSWDYENDDFDGKIPSVNAAYALFGGGTRGFPNSSYNSIADSGHISGLNSLFDGFKINNSDDDFEAESCDSIENLNSMPCSFESLTGYYLS